jgi:hypothetical protein
VHVFPPVPAPQPGIENPFPPHPEALPSEGHAGGVLIPALSPENRGWRVSGEEETFLSCYVIKIPINGTFSLLLLVSLLTLPPQGGEGTAGTPG